MKSEIKLVKEEIISVKSLVSNSFPVYNELGNSVSYFIWNAVSHSVWDLGWGSTRSAWHSVMDSIGASVKEYTRNEK